MKFENDWIRIVIERKQLTREQKENRRWITKDRFLKTGISFALIAALLAGVLYGSTCSMKGEEAVFVSESGDKEESADPGNAGDEESVVYIEQKRLAGEVKEKYENHTIYGHTYGEPIEDLGRGDNLVFELGYDATAIEGVEYWYEIYGIYQDPELTEPVIAGDYLWDPEKKTLTMTPSHYGVNKVAFGGLSTEQVKRYEHSDNLFFDRGSGADWGNLGTLYLAQYYDEQTGQKLEKPIVRIITLKGELEDTPHLTYSVLEDGRAQFSWTPVEGAEDYLICRVKYREERGLDSMMFALAMTKETTWTTEQPEYDLTELVNREFKTYRVSEDDWNNEGDYEYYKDQYEPGQVVYKDTSYGEEGICVIAICKEGTSMASNYFLNRELAPKLPHCIAFDTERANGFAESYERVKELPVYDYVTMCDGITNQRLIDYQTEDANVSMERFILLDEEGNFTGAEDLLCLHIPYRVEGTPFYYTMRVDDYQEENLERDLEFLEKREADLRKKSGELSLKMAHKEIDRETEVEAEEKQVRKVEDTPVFASSALSEYLALSMLGGATSIDLSDFPEARDLSLAEDALLEAYYQNPLILGLKEYQFNRRGTVLNIAYDDTASVQARKQEEIREEVSRVIKRIIRSNMTEEEKELAINEYLCDTVTYDEDALANAEQNDFMYVDQQYNDSFTAYGALMNGRCVCAGYAGAFKLLAQEAGLETIVVTGFLDGSLSHAWNKVLIGNEWQIVDVTNNDNDRISNALFNLPAFAGDRVLVEDRDYMQDKAILNYTGSSEEYEFYHMTDSYFPVQEIAQRLTEGLKEKREITLRTDYALDDDDFYNVTDAVFEALGEDAELYGCYWIGVIYLSLE